MENPYRPLRLKSSASLTSLHNGTDNPAAIEWATFKVGFRWNRSIKEIIFGARSAFSAKDSWVKPLAFRWFRTATPNALAKSFDRIRQICQFGTHGLQEQLFQFIRLRFCSEGAISISDDRSGRKPQNEDEFEGKIMKKMQLTVLMAGLSSLVATSEAQLAEEPDWRIHNGTVENIWADQNWGRFTGKVIKVSSKGIWCEGYFSSPQTAVFVPDDDMSDSSENQYLHPNDSYVVLIRNLHRPPAIGQNIDVMVRYRGKGVYEGNLNTFGGVEGFLGQPLKHHYTIVGYEAPNGQDSLILDYCAPTAPPHLSDVEQLNYSSAKSKRLKEIEEAESRKALAAKESLILQENEKAERETKTLLADIAKATNGFASSQYKLGLRYLKGDGVTKNDVKAKEWLEKAAAQDDFDAKKTLAALSYRIDLGDKLLMSEVNLALQDVDSYQYKLGMRFLNGDGVTQNKAFAREWLDKAAKNGNNDAKKVLSTLSP